MLATKQRSRRAGEQGPHDPLRRATDANCGFDVRCLPTRERSAMSGTDVVNSAMWLRKRYAMSGTDVHKSAICLREPSYYRQARYLPTRDIVKPTRALCDVRY
eukprot:3810594-Rhodomonas_salina.2